MADTPGLGSVLKVTITGTPTTVAQQVRHAGPRMIRAPIDKTVLTDTWRQFLAGIKNGGQITMEGYMDASAASQVYLDTSFGLGTVETWSRTFADTGTAVVGFSGFITELEYGEAEIDQLVPIRITIQVSGTVTLTP